MDRVSRLEVIQRAANGVHLSGISLYGTNLSGLDLSGLEFICSVGLGAIVTAHVGCARRQGGVRLACPSSEITHLLWVARLTDLLPVHESVEAAVAACN